MYRDDTDCGTDIATNCDCVTADDWRLDRRCGSDGLVSCDWNDEISGKCEWKPGCEVDIMCSDSACDCD